MLDILVLVILGHTMEFNEIMTMGIRLLFVPYYFYIRLILVNVPLLNSIVVNIIIGFQEWERSRF